MKPAACSGDIPDDTQRSPIPRRIQYVPPGMTVYELKEKIMADKSWKLEDIQMYAKGRGLEFFRLHAHAAPPIGKEMEDDKLVRDYDQKGYARLSTVYGSFKPKSM